LALAACPITYGCRDLTDPQQRPGYAAAVAVADRAEIWTRGAPARFFDSQWTDGIRLRARDFSPSGDDGPRKFASIEANRGQRVQLEPCTHFAQLGRTPAMHFFNHLFPWFPGFRKSA
jgi:hypothetical protein